MILYNRGWPGPKPEPTEMNPNRNPGEKTMKSNEAFPSKYLKVESYA